MYTSKMHTSTIDHENNFAVGTNYENLTYEKKSCIHTLPRLMSNQQLQRAIPGSPDTW